MVVVCVDFCKRMGWVEYPPLTLETARTWAPMNLFFCLVLFTGVASLQHNSIPMVTIFKNIGTIMTAVGDYFFFQSQPEFLVKVAFVIMFSGTVAAGWTDIDVSVEGLFWMVLNCCATAGYVLYMKYATKHVKLSKFGMVYVNNVLCIVFLLPAAILMGEFRRFRNSPSIHSIDYVFTNVIAGMIGFLLNFASLHCVATTGPTTYAVTGSVNRLPTAIFGYLLFKSIITLQTWIFIAFSMAGGFLYTYAKLQTAREQQQQQQQSASAANDKEDDTRDNDSSVEELEMLERPDADHDERRK